MIKKSFTLRILVISFLLIALPLLVDAFIFFQRSYYDAIADAKNALKSETNFRVFNLLTIQPVSQALLSELIYILELGEGLENPDQAKLSRTLSQVVHEGGEFQLSILKVEKDSRFKIVASSDAALLNTYFFNYQVLQDILKKGEGSFIRYSYSKEAQRQIPYVFTAQAIKSKKTGEPIGIILATANVENQFNALIEPGAAYPNIKYAIVSGDEIIFSATDPHLVGHYLEPLSQQVRNEILASGQLNLQQLAPEPLSLVKSTDLPFFEFIFNDQVQIAYRAFAPIGKISLMGYSSKEDFFAIAIRHFLLLYTIYGVIFVIGGGVTYWLSLWISRPLRELSQLMMQVSKGNLSARFKEAPLGFEINILGKLFNQTLDNLLENIQHAEDERVKKETYQRELSIIRQVQNSLLPRAIPHIKGAEFAGIYLPASDVGGDYYGYLTKKTQSGEEALLLIVADAAGRGISSSLYALSARSLLRTYGTLYDNVGEILSFANNDFIRDAGDTGMFLRVVYGMYHADSKILTYYSCGHLPGFVRRQDGEIITLAHSGIAIGLKESGPYSPDEIQLLAGDIVVFYTDGLIDAVNEKNEPYTEMRLKRHLQAKEWRSAQEVVESVTADVQEFTHEKAQEGEIIVVVLRVKGSGEV
jgi:phosphoserine phosphatase RsbU/P